MIFINIAIFKIIIVSIVLLICGYTDLKERRIPNIISIPFILIGIIINAFIGEYKLMLIGFGTAFIIGLISWILGGMGGGDFKLMVGIGTWLGTYPFVNILFMASIIGLIWATVCMIKRKILKEKATEIAIKAYHFNAIGLKNLFKKQENENSITIAFGTCLCIATLIFFGTGGIIY